MSLKSIVEISNRYGGKSDYVLAGGGNTSYKTKTELYIKGSGTSLATITEAGFVRMSRARLGRIWEKEYSSDTDVREAEVLADMMAAKLPGEEGKRPSVETLLHDLFRQTYVLHVHPTLVNALTCSVGGEKLAEGLLPGCVWVDECEPGYILAKACREKLEAYRRERGVEPKVVLLQNHGIFFAAESKSELSSTVAGVMKALGEHVGARADFKAMDDGAREDEAVKAAPAIRMAYDGGGNAVVRYSLNRTVLEFAQSREAFEVLKKPLTPDHIVYCKAEPLFLESPDTDAIASAFAEYESRRGFRPKIVFVKDVGMFAVGKNLKDAVTAEAVWNDAMAITVMSESFGGVRHMADRLADFIVNWEVESYRAKVALVPSGEKKLAGKIALVTGAAQGFGAGIAEYLGSLGAAVVIADMNAYGAAAEAEVIEKKYGVPALAVEANVSDEESVKSMVREVVLSLGGVDVFVNNAGIVRAGALDEMKKADFELVTSVNYTAYFLCAKYVSAVMKVQRKVSPGYMADIIEINSKSGLAGSNKNFAYAGSKFGGIGLTQSFALELAPFGIKVNAVCPGNFLDGPLWSDPEKGLFVQYLRAGKVPGAKTVEDVRAYYEGKVPLGRGCRIEDVCRAVEYIIGQKYETGQALPVTGGQEMLK